MHPSGIPELSRRDIWDGDPLFVPENISPGGRTTKENGGVNDGECWLAESATTERQGELKRWVVMAEQGRISVNMKAEKWV